MDGTIPADVPVATGTLRIPVFEFIVNVLPTLIPPMERLVAIGGVVAIDFIASSNVFNNADPTVAVGLFTGSNTLLTILTIPFVFSLASGTVAVPL